MTYNKPEITVLKSGINSIQASTSKNSAYPDHSVPPTDPLYPTPTESITAYEVDE